MKCYIEGDDQEQGLLFSDYLENFIGENNSVRAIDAFVDALDLLDLGFAEAATTGRSGYHPNVLLKIYVRGTSIVSNRTAGCNWRLTEM